jgi:predicted TIM-barrel fold metal-dependent hydrolase
VKISGAYRTGSQTPDYSDVAPLAKALIAANPLRILWGSDRPHPNTVPKLRVTDASAPLSIDDGKLLNLLPIWAPDAALRKRILVENPTQVYFS